MPATLGTYTGHTARKMRKTKLIENVKCGAYFFGEIYLLQIIDVIIDSLLHHRNRAIGSARTKN